jgi:hypothetical protein
MKEVGQEIYVMRFWHERGQHDRTEAWRVTITDTRSQEKFHFAGLETLFRFFRERLGDTGNSESESASET